MKTFAPTHEALTQYSEALATALEATEQLATFALQTNDPETFAEAAEQLAHLHAELSGFQGYLTGAT